MTWKPTSFWRVLSFPTAVTAFDEGFAGASWTGGDARRSIKSADNDSGDIDSAVHWVLGRPGIFVASPGDIHLMPKALDAASRFESAPDEETMREQRARLEMLPLFV